MLRKFKEKRIERIRDIITGQLFTILLDFSKSPTSEIDEFKNVVRGARADLMVAKNTLAKTALKRAGGEEWMVDVARFFQGSTALVYGAEDISICAKAIRKFHRGRDKKMQVKAILFDGKVYGAEKFASFTELLSKEELRARLLGIMLAPQSNFVRVLKQIPQGMAAVVRAYSENKAGDS